MVERTIIRDSEIKQFLRDATPEDRAGYEKLSDTFGGLMTEAQYANEYVDTISSKPTGRKDRQDPSKDSYLWMVKCQSGQMYSQFYPEQDIRNTPLANINPGDMVQVGYLTKGTYRNLMSIKHATGGSVTAPKAKSSAPVGDALRQALIVAQSTLERAIEYARHTVMLAESDKYTQEERFEQIVNDKWYEFFARIMTLGSSENLRELPDKDEAYLVLDGVDEAS